MAETKNSFPQKMFEPEAGACQVVLVRHGQSQARIEGEPFELVEGHGNPPLSDRGLWQAEQVGARLADEPITALYASNLTRTQQTAAPLAARLNLATSIDRDLREIFLGDFEGGLFRLKAAQGHPSVAAFRENQQWGEIPGAETNAELQSRVVGSVKRIAQSHPDEMVAVFCHGGVIASLLAFALDRDDFSFFGARNASVSFVSVTPGRWTLRTFNDAAHCGPLTRDLDPAN